MATTPVVLAVIKRIFRHIQLLLTDPFYKARFFFAYAFERGHEVNQKLVMFETFNGERFGGSPYYLLRHMQKDSRYSGYKVCIAVSASALNETRVLLSKSLKNDFEIVVRHSRKYCNRLCQAKYLINNSTFPSYFIKRDEQIYLNTWHGTPLKAMGKRIANEAFAIGNTQRNFLMADYLIYSNRYTFERFTEDYMLKGLIKGEEYITGYPCNSVFYDLDARNKARAELSFTGKKVVAFMPTWRSNPGYESDLQAALKVLDERLGKDVLVLVKLHYYESSQAGGLAGYKHIEVFPARYETYEVLNAVDVLVTDYSSVMFDFMNTGRDVVLYCPDVKEYTAERGLYLDLDELPFALTHDTDGLCKAVEDALEGPSVEPAYASARELYCSCDGPDVVMNICELLFCGHSSNLKPEASTLERRPITMIFCGGLTKNGITTSLLGLLDSLNTDDRKYILSFMSSKGEKAPDFIQHVSERFTYYPFQGRLDMTLGEALALVAYFRLNRKGSWIDKKVSRCFARDVRRLCSDIGLSSAVHFTGYERNIANMFLEMPECSRVIFAHNDMAQEWKSKKNFHLPTITRAYNEFENVAVVREGLVDIITDEFMVSKKKIKVVHNLNRIDYIKEAGARAILFDEETESNWTIEAIQQVLSDPATKVFINVARFSPEKGLKRLIEAFAECHAEYPDTVLIVIGGYGKDYEEILNLANGCKAPVAVIKQVNNPLPFVSQSDAFILSSFYEGLPMAVMEALILGVPIVSTEIPGPKEFLQQGYGALVPNTTQGICEAMKQIASGGEPNTRSFDAEEFNLVALKEFEALFTQSCAVENDDE